MMWELVYADGQVTEFEDNVVWRAADLLGHFLARPDRAQASRSRTQPATGVRAAAVGG